MKRRVILLILVISLIVNGLLAFVSWQNKLDKKPIFDPFKVNYNVTEKELVKAGYTRIPEDVILLGKQSGDTMIYYQLDDWDSKKEEHVKPIVSYRFCVIYLDKIDSLCLQKMISKYDAEIISNFQQNVDSTYYQKTFFVRQKQTNEIFQCEVTETTGTLNDKRDGFEMVITNNFPNH